MWNDKPNASAGSLAGLRVIDASRVLGGPFCGQVLADHGADVIKVEPPMGDETRGWGPPFAGDAASYFIGVNRNKRDISIDMTQPPARSCSRACWPMRMSSSRTSRSARWSAGDWARTACANAFRAWCIAVSPALAPTALMARSRATTRPCKP